MTKKKQNVITLKDVIDFIWKAGDPELRLIRSNIERVTKIDCKVAKENISVGDVVSFRSVKANSKPFVYRGLVFAKKSKRAHIEVIDCDNKYNLPQNYPVGSKISVPFEDLTKINLPKYLTNSEF
jgi:hypothetical protein